MTSAAAYCSSCGAAAAGPFCSSCGAAIAGPPPPGYRAAPLGYGAAAGYGYPAPRPTSGLAIGALVAAFFFAPAGLVLGIMAKKEIQRTGADGDGLATAAIVVSAVSMVIGLIAIIAVLAAFGTSSSY